MVARERRIEVDGLHTRYLEAGDGDPLVLLHALGESSLDWRWVILGLARTHHVYAPDLPGFGDSAKRAVGYSPPSTSGSPPGSSMRWDSGAPPWRATRSVALPP